MDALLLVIFVLVYAGMILGEFPGLALDRSGIALLGGFYTQTVRWIAARAATPEALLRWVVIAAGALSAVLANDIVCLAMAPMLIEICARRQVAAVPFLLALACASNVGSAATLIGNPQNMFIGEALRLPFGGFVAAALPPAAAGLLATWLIIAWQWRGRWADAGVRPAHEEGRPFDRGQTARGLVMLALTVAAFLFSPWPRDIVAMLLLPGSSGPEAGPVLALASTFAGNLLIVGSIANIIVVEQAGARGVKIDWRTHARTGVPVTLATLAIAAGWIWAGL